MNERNSNPTNTRDQPGGLRLRRRIALAAGACAMIVSIGSLASKARAGDDGRESTVEAKQNAALPDSTHSKSAENGDEPRSIEEVFPWTREQFFYSLRVNGAEAMRATIKVGELGHNRGHPYVPVGVSVHSRGFFDNVYPVDDRADTYINPVTMRPYRSEKYFREAGKVRTYIVDYVHEAYSARVHKSKPGRVHRFQNAIPATTHDMVTWLYHLRRRELAQGETYRYFVYDGWKLSHVYMTVVGKEDLYTPAGWFKAWKFRFVRKILGSRKNRQGGRKTAPVLQMRDPAEHTGYFWLSRDENHLPLRVTIPTKFGFGEAVLIEYERPDHR